MANANEIAKPTRLPWVQGNQIELALPLQIVYFTENGKYIQDYTPQQGDVIEVLLESKCHCYEYTPTIEDGNVLHVVDNGQLCVGSYSVTVVITNETSGKKLRSKWNYVIDVFDDNAKVVDEFDDFPDWGEGAIIDNSVFYFVGTKDIEYITVDTISQLPQEGVIGNIYRVANYDGTQVNPNAYAEYYWNGTQHKLLDVKNYGIDEKPTNGSTNLVESGGTKSLLDEKANKNGYYETLGAGTATNLRAIDAHDNTFKYRKTGGTQSIVSGTASIESIKGNTLAWNQWYDYMTNPFISYLSSNVSVTKTNLQYDATVLDFTKTGYTIGIRSTYTLKHVSGHKYCLHAEIKSSIPGNFACEISNLSSGVVAVTSSWTRCAFFRTAGSSVDKSVIVKPQGIYYTQENNTYSVKDINIFDLTLIYGEGNEPSTPEQFEADYLRWFGKFLTYEPYDAGSLRNVQMQGLKTTGFNQWDEEWELGTIGIGADHLGLVSSTTQIRSKNYIKVLPNTTYYVHCQKSSFGGFFVGGCSDTNGNNAILLLSRTGGSSFTTRSSTNYIKFSMAAAYGTTYNNDICINISDTNKNGTYEPYEEHNVSVPVTTLTGKVNGQGSSVVIFPDGMKGVGDVKDEIKVENGVTKAIRRIGRVDLGSLNWTFYGSSSATVYNVDSIKWTSQYIELLCSKYLKKQTNQGIYTVTNVLRLVDDSIISSDVVNGTIQKLSGVMLDYELAEPVEYVVNDFGLPINYKAISGGTEEIIDIENTIGISPTTLIRYSIDAAKTITNLPIDYQSQESMANLLNALGAAMGGTWTTTFDASTNRYTYSFTPNT